VATTYYLSDPPVNFFQEQNGQTERIRPPNFKKIQVRLPLVKYYSTKEGQTEGNPVKLGPETQCQTPRVMYYFRELRIHPARIKLGLWTGYARPQDKLFLSEERKS
jgi:hypothetical protein